MHVPLLRMLPQVAISFPGAEFLKCDVGSTQHFTDEHGTPIASNGAELAEVLRDWLTADWLGGVQASGLTHVFVDKTNLQYVEGSVRATNLPGAKPEAYAVLNENWAVYLREAFLEARLVIFLFNQDWLDSIPCNLEFEGLIKHKPGMSTQGPCAVVFVNMTDPAHQEAALPELYEAMQEQAAKYFDVHLLTFHDRLQPEQKVQFRRDLRALAERYCQQKHELPQGTSKSGASRSY